MHPFRLVRRLGLISTAAAVIVASLALSPSIATADESAPAPSATTSGPIMGAPNLGADWGKDLVFERAGEVVGDLKNQLTLSPQPDGSVMFLTGDRCLGVVPHLGGVPDNILFPLPCRDEALQKFYFVPQNHTPTSAPNGSRGDQYFYIVNAATNMCIWAPEGLNSPPPTPSHIARVLTCSEGDVAQEYRVWNEQPNPDGVYNEWRNILNLAAIYATNHCAADQRSCSVAPTGAPAGSWYRPVDDSVTQYGTMTTANAGCGAKTVINGITYSPTYHNDGDDQAAWTLGTQLTQTNSTQVTETLGYTLNVETGGGLKDVWAVKITNGFVYNHQKVEASSTAQTSSNTVSLPVRSGSYVMATWGTNVYTITGQWRFAEDLAVLDPANRTLKWTMPATSSFPVRLETQPVAVLGTVTSHEPKNCTAVPGSKIKPGSTPQITTADASCDSPVTTPASASVGTTLKACPGSWNVPLGQGSSDPNFKYQWYVIGADGTAARPILGATGKTFTVQTSTYSAETPNLGFSVYDAGNIDRVESRPAEVTPVSVRISPPAAGDPQRLATNVVGELPEAHVGVPYSENLVTDAGSAMDLTATGVPDGLTFSDGGVLSGTPVAPGVAEITVTDTPTDGGPVAEHTLELSTYTLPSTFRADTAFESTVGADIREALADELTPGARLELTEGSLPPGVELDPSSGLVTGAATRSGQYGFVVEDPNAPGTTAAFTLVVTNAAPTFATAALPAGTVGSPYSASTVDAPGTGSLFALAGDSAALPAGLNLDPTSGVLSGTPTEAVSGTVRVLDLTNRGAVFASALEVTGQGSSPAKPSVPATPAAPGSLAATGSSEAATLAGLGAMLAAAGLVMMLLRMRRRRI